jgi:hypothetical protein
MARPIITLTTDFGEGSSYVAQMKGAILSINPEVNIVDVSHSIRPQDVRHGALVLDDCARHFPSETVHIVVVDPDVGTARAILCATYCGHRFIAPDNGLLTSILETQAARQVVRLEEARFWNAEVSSTFHGRDIMAPVAAHLTQGIQPRELGPIHKTPVLIEFPNPIVSEHEIVGEIIAIDTFGNLITNIDDSRLEAETKSICTVRCCEQVVQGISIAYGDADSGRIVALFGSSRRLEIAVVNGDAAKQLGAAIGDKVWVDRLDD